MPEPEATPEFQATADLSPLCPSPVHRSAVPDIVPALQDTADLLDAMSTGPTDVAHRGVAAAHAAYPQSESQASLAQFRLHTEAHVDVSADDTNNDADDTDSLGDAYGEEEQDTGVIKAQEQQPVEPDAGEDDYLKIFDSPPSGVEDELEDDVSKARESMHSSAASDTLTSSLQVASSTSDPSPARPAAADHVAPATAATAQRGADAALLNGRDAREDDHAADISRLVAEMTGQGSNVDPNPTPPSQNHAQSSFLSPVATLPPRPPLPPASSAFPPAEEYRTFHQNTHVSAGLNGNAPTPLAQAPAQQPYLGSFQGQSTDNADHQKLWEQFTTDERHYMADGKWDKFPDGSRIFIGNLSSERVSRRDVFNIFHQCGRLAQISLKSAYGFVQYHDLESAQTAMKTLQGIEIKGRKIHLEPCHVQKKKEGNERNRSPDRSRGGRQGRQDRNDGSHSHDRRSRDDHRSSRNSPPRRSNGFRDDSNGRDRYQYGSHDRRGRSRSPQHGRQHDQYRVRSPTPTYGQERLQVPRRYGNQVPDVQILLLDDISHDFTSHVERVFTDRGLKVDGMFLHPRYNRDDLKQQHASEGVHAIVDLDKNAERIGKISMRVFNRERETLRYDDYCDIDLAPATEIVVIAKRNSGQHQVAPSQPLQQMSGYVHAYMQQYGQPRYGSQNGPQYGQPPAYPGDRRPPPQAPAQAPTHQLPPQAHPAFIPATLINAMEGMDNGTLRQLLANINPGSVPLATSNGTGVSHTLPAFNGGFQTAPPAAPAVPAAHAAGVPSYAQSFHTPPSTAHPPSDAHSPTNPGVTQTAAIENIMAQLAKYRN